MISHPFLCKIAGFFCPKRPRAISGQPDKKGFTLVEVTLALGVASFGLISMMGLLTVGLKTMHDAINTTTEAEISQQVANQIQLANYSTVSASAAQTYYFNDEGFATTSASAAYAATVAAPLALSTPGGAASANMKRISITIWSVGAPQKKNVFPIEIANNGN